MSTTAGQIRDTLQEIANVRAGMHNASGWSWRAVGYHYDPDEQAHAELQQLLRKLDAQLADKVLLG